MFDFRSIQGICRSRACVFFLSTDEASAVIHGMCCFGFYYGSRILFSFFFSFFIISTCIHSLPLGNEDCTLRRPVLKETIPVLPEH